MAISSQLTVLAQSILDNAKLLEQYCVHEGVPLPSFEKNGPPRFQPSQPQAAEAQAKVLALTMELNQLVAGPMGMLMNTELDDYTALHAIYHFGIAKATPLDREISFDELSLACGLNTADLKRLIRMATTRHIFVERHPGYIEHTAASKLLADSKLVHDFVGIITEEKFKASASTVDALVKWGAAKDPTQTGFSLGHNTKLGLYEELQTHPERAARWANAMAQFASRIPLEPLFASFDWNKLGNATVVDVGGGHGPVSLGLAKKFPRLRFVVQDFPAVVDSRPAIEDPNISERVKYMGHDILADQPIHGAAVYFFRAVYHNYPDTQCVHILKQHAKVMTDTSLMIINETFLHEPGSLPTAADRKKRAMDISMLTYFGSRERNGDDWEHLLAMADSRFELRDIVQPVPNANHTVIIGFNG